MAWFELVIKAAELFQVTISEKSFVEVCLAYLPASQFCDVFVSFLFFFFLLRSTCVCWCYVWKHMSGREKENHTAVQTAVYSAAASAKPRRDSMGTVSSSRACRFFQIAYLPLWLCQKGFVWDQDPSASISLLMQSRAITITAWIAELIASAWGFSGIQPASHKDTTTM